MPSDVIIAKNYLDKKELTHLNLIGNMYLDYAEMQAARGKSHEDGRLGKKKLNAFLRFSEYEILTNAGTISHKVAEQLALKEYGKYRRIQDKNYISDFDRIVKKLRKITPLSPAGRPYGNLYSNYINFMIIKWTAFGAVFFLTNKK